MKTDIIIGIILTLLNRGKATCKELAYKYEVSQKTIYRYISVLDTSGVPIYSKRGKNGGIYILNTFKLNSMFFTTQEKMTLVTVCSCINNKELRTSLQTKILSIK